MKLHNFQLLLTAGIGLMLANSCSDNNRINIDVTGISLDIPVLTLLVGEEQALTATITPENATDKTLIWTSSDNTKANVDNGKVKAISTGTSTIFATTKDGNKSAQCRVAVYPSIVYVTGVTLNKTTITLKEGYVFS